MPAVEDQLLSKGGIRITGAGEGSNRVLTSDASGVGTWQTLGTPTAVESTPIGSIMPFGGAAAPSGWLVCDGSAVSRTTYTLLFAALGTTFGAGDGVTTFNLPDLRGRSLVGAGQGATLTNRALGGTGGEETHKLLAAESGLPQHTHGFTNIQSYSKSNSANYGYGTGANPAIFYDGASNPITNAGPSDAAQAHNIMQPFAVVNYIVKATSIASSQQFSLAAQAVPAVRARRSTNQSAANGAWTALSFDQVRWDTDSIWSAVTPTRLTVRTPGVYQLIGTALFTGVNAGAYRFVGLRINNTNFIVKDGEVTNAQFGANSIFISAGTVFKFNAGDYVEMLVYQDSGAALNILTDDQDSIEFSMVWLGEGRGVVGDQAVPAARVRMAANQSILDSTTTPVTFAAARWDTDGMWASTNPTRLTIRTPGIYDIGAVTYFQASGTNDRSVGIRVNGGATTWSSVKSPNVDLGRAHVHTSLQLNAGDYVEMVVWQNSGAAAPGLTLVYPGGNDWGSEMWATLSGPAARNVIPYARVRKSANQAIAPDAWRAITWDVEDSDNDGIHDNVTTNTRLTCRTPGVYHISGGVSVVESAGGTAFRRLFGIFKNGVEMSRTEYTARDSVSGATVEANLELIAGDYVELMYYAVTDNTATINSTQQMTHFEMVKIGLSGQSGVSGGTQWAQNGTDIQPTNSGKVRFPNGIYTEPWHTVGGAGESAVFQNGWTNYDGSSTAGRYARFRKDPDGTVILQGVVKSGAANPIFTLPVGYRPTRTLEVPASVNGAFGIVNVDANGGVNVNAAFLGAGATYTFLDSIRFPAEQ